jgi:hypothetical protein
MQNVIQSGWEKPVGVTEDEAVCVCGHKTILNAIFRYDVGCLYDMSKERTVLSVQGRVMQKVFCKHNAMNDESFGPVRGPVRNPYGVPIFSTTTVLAYHFLPLKLVTTYCITYHVTTTNYRLLPRTTAW